MKLKAELKKYCKNIIADKPLSCEKHKQACARFLRDLKRENTKAFPYVFIEKKALRFFDWTKLFKHRKGVLKGKFIELAPIQRFIFGNIYGWYHNKTGYRRFNKMYWQVARKNTKSQSLSLVCSYELMAFDETGDEAQEVYCAATKREQAKIVYDETVAVIEKCALLKERDCFTVAYGKITHRKSGSIMRALSEEDKKTGDGLNPQCGTIDEYHAHETSEIYDIIESGMGARTQPLLAIITTAGFELANPCYRVEYDLVSKILDPNTPVDLENYFVMINELEINTTAEKVTTIDGRIVPPGDPIDDIKKVDNWIKANPIVCSYPEGTDGILKALKESLEAPEKMRNFLTKRMNIWVNQRAAGYMNMGKWSALKEKIPDLKGSYCVVGLDLSAKIDLTSIAFEFLIDGNYVILSHSFIPESTFEAKKKTDKVPYDLWLSQGWLTVTPGEVVDYRVVKNYGIERAEKEGFKILEWCLDPWGAVQISAELIEEGATVIEIIQGIKTLSEPTKNFRESVYTGKVIHEHNPLLAWGISNAVVDTVDRNENLILNKKKSKQRIDPIAAVINAHVRAMVMPKPVKAGVSFF